MRYTRPEIRTIETSHVLAELGPARALIYGGGPGGGGGGGGRRRGGHHDDDDD